MKVSELGEFGLIARLSEALGAHPTLDAADRLAVGIGDDAAVWRANGSALIATTDTLVAGVHFLADRAPWRDVGWKALVVNVSDIAAMGGTPEFALVTLALPENTQVEAIDELYAGVAEAAEAYGVVITGGDVVRSPTTVITIALTGRAALDDTGKALVLRRDAAQAGDVVAVTGQLGGAAGGLRRLRDSAKESSGPLVERQLRPCARVQAGQAALAAGVRCAIDVSDGLLQDLGQVCRASGLGGVVWRDKLPIDPALSEVFAPEEALRFAAGGGEDYELLLIGDQQTIGAAAKQADVPVTVIGEMVIDAKQEAKLLDEAGEEVSIPSAGWDHLRSGGES
ncbi:MAG: thiamine-phosphate kinase [Dehalococcoidia bacterium]